MADVVAKQMDIVIALLARHDPGLGFIHTIVTRGKREPAAYIRAYNALDGTIGVTGAGKIAGVSQPTMTSVLQNWEVEGIVYDVGEPHKPLYKRLTLLPERLSEERG